MKLLICLMMAASFAFQTSSAEWMTGDLQKAQAKAKTDNKLLLVFFTGSDWCGFCIRMDKEVFRNKQFVEYAREHLVLFEADFPRRKKLDPGLQASNQALLKKHGVKGFPTVLLFDSAGKKLFEESGYRGQGVKAFIAQLDKHRKP